MMDCNGFKRWLISRDDCDAGTSQRARRHREECPECDRLYAADESLEQALSSGIRTTAIPSGLARRARALADAKLETAGADGSIWFRRGLAPALALGLMLVLVVWNPWANPLSSLEAIGNYALANHTQADLTMAFRVQDTPDPQEWFFNRLDYRITIPDFHDRGFNLRGGRECTIGPKKAAYLFYDDNGRRVSVFVIPAGHIKMSLQEDRRYLIEAPRHQLELWKAGEMVCILVQDRYTDATTT